jgi:hypothetical protein
MKRIFAPLTIAFSVFMVGCVSNPTVQEPKIEYRTKTMLAVIPDHLLPNCLQPVPPEQAKYKAASATDKEKMLIEYTEGLIQTVTVCNNTIDGARTWNAKQKELFLKQYRENAIRELNEQ